MYQVGHYGVALLLYTPLGAAVAMTGYEGAAVVGAVVCVAVSTSPDLDHRVPMLDHRGRTHTIVFALIVGIGLAAATSVLIASPSPIVDVGFVLFAFLVGTLSIGSHLLADALTPMGIRPFWPISQQKYTFEVTTAANPIANYVLFALGVLAALAGVAIVTAVG